MSMSEIDNDPVLTEQDIETILDSNDFVTMSFRIRKTYLKKMRDYAYTNRLEQKEALDQILGEFLNKIDDGDLLEYREKPRKKRKRG